MSFTDQGINTINDIVNRSTNTNSNDDMQQGGQQNRQSQQDGQ